MSTPQPETLVASDLQLALNDALFNVPAPESATLSSLLRPVLPENAATFVSVSTSTLNGAPDRVVIDKSCPIWQA